VDFYVTEQEQIETLKTWWKKYGVSILTGLVIGAAILFGWRTWQGQQDRVTGEASAIYQQMVASVTEKKPEEVKRKGENLVEQYSKTPYAPLAALMLTKLALEADDIARAKEHLEWASKQSKQPGVKMIAQMRLARVLIGEGKAEDALALLAAMKVPPKMASYHELKGDALAALGKTGEARREYLEALALGEVQTGGSVLQLKLDDLGPAPESEGAASTKATPKPEPDNSKKAAAKPEPGKTP
jgi:predicted negative regulator of RcsB-dependent stress response